MLRSLFILILILFLSFSSASPKIRTNLHSIFKCRLATSLPQSHSFANQKFRINSITKSFPLFRLFNGTLILFGVSGISRKTQELYAIVFMARYLDLFTDFISVYNTFMKLIFIASSLAIVWCMRFHPVVRRSYDRELDTFRYFFLVGASFALALVWHDKFTLQEVRYYFLIRSPVLYLYSLLLSVR